MAKKTIWKKSLKSDKQNGKLRRIALVLILAIVSTVFTDILTSKAQSAASPIQTHAYVTISPNPVGINQEATITMWLSEFNPTASGPLGDRWQNYTILITKPSGTTQTLGPFTADAASYAYTLYTPNTVGAYTLTFSFPGQHVTGFGVLGTPVDAYYGASSYTVNFTVQQEPATTFPQAPIPTEYWTRPINAQNQQWYTISGNWLGTGVGFGMGYTSYNIDGNFNPFTTAPDSAHILWTKPLEFGGLIGGEFGSTSTSNYYTGKMYEPAFGPPVIINGVLYYNSPAPPRMGFYAVDLRTGQTLWRQNSTGSVYNTSPILIGYWGYPGITNGQIYNYLSPNQEGGIPYLWFIPPNGVNNAGGVNMDWIMYDAVSGDSILSITNVPAIQGAIVEGPNGELLDYVLDGTNNWLAMWNSSRCIGTLGDYFPMSTNFWAWRPQVGATLNWSNGIQWNVTTSAYPGQAIAKINSGVILATTGSIILSSSWQWEIGYDMTTGSELWVQNRTLPALSAWQVMGGMAEEIYTEFNSATMQWTGYDVYTGQKVWGPSEAYTNAWGVQSVESMSAYGNLYGVSVDGVHAFNITTGQHLWDFNAASSGLDFPGYSTYPFLTYSLTIADEKVFAGTGNSYGAPLFRGAHLYAIDANTGQECWSFNGFFLDTMPVADGILVAFNGYDNQIYAFSKGQTATTVESPMTGVTLGNDVVIRGTVTDQSPGQTCLGIPAAGTPAISDDSMSAWMEYLYEQQPKPTNATGVPVKLETLDPNGNFYEIGNATSDASGTFGLAFTPEVPGLYTIIATFEGSNSYYGSYAETYINVEEAPAAQPTPTPPPPTMTDTYIIGFGSAALIAIIVIGAILILLRKR